MTDGAVRDFVTPADEIVGPDGVITTDDLLDEVSLYNLYDDRTSPEQDAERILSITYPTTTLSTIIENTSAKLHSAGTLPRGGHVIGGEYGSGKSHIELVLYHLLNSPDQGQDWLDAAGIDASLPDNTRTAALQMLNLDEEYDKLSTAVGDYLGVEALKKDELPPVHEIRDALGDTPTAIFVDEFERWFGMSVRESYRDDNLAFLQNLLEAAGRADTPLCVYVSLLYESDDVEAIVQRTNPFTYDLSARRDEKIRFLLHRLIGDRDEEGIAGLAKQYTDVYRRNDQIDLSDYHEMEGRIDRYYPFHPTLLDLLLDKYSEQRSHQDARGLLRFLTELLGDKIDDVDLVLTGDVAVFDYTNWFRFIDSELVSRYLNDYHRLGDPVDESVEGGRKTFPEHVEELMNIVLLHSLARGGEEGANKLQMLLGTIRKGVSALDVVQTFRERVYGHAWHIHRINGEYAYDVDENPAARIEKKTDDVHKDDAIHRVERLILEDFFDGRTNVHILSPVNTEQSVPDKKGLTVVVSLSAKRGYDDDFDALAGEPDREWVNTLVFVTPEKRSSIDTNTGIIELARKVVAGEQLKREDGVLPAGFDDIHEQNYQNLSDRVRDKFGTVHLPTDRGLFPESLSLDDGFYRGVLAVVEPDTTQLQSEVSRRVKEAGGGGIQYEFLLKDFLRDTSYTTLTDEDDLRNALNALCRDETVKVGTYFGKSVGSLGQDTTVVHSDYVETDDGDTETDGLTPDTSGNPGDGDGEAVSGDGGAGETTTGESPEQTSIGATEGNTATPDTDVEETATPERHPSIGAIETDNRPDLIDRLERDLEYDWVIHEMTVEVKGTLSAEDLPGWNLDDDSLAGNIELDDTFNFNFPEGRSRQAILSLLWELRVPEDATFSVTMQVVKGD